LVGEAHARGVVEAHADAGAGGEVRLGGGVLEEDRVGDRAVDVARAAERHRELDAVLEDLLAEVRLPLVIADVDGVALEEVQAVADGEGGGLAEGDGEAVGDAAAEESPAGGEADRDG